MKGVVVLAEFKDVVTYRFSKNSKEEVRAGILKVNDKDYAFVRTYYNANYGGDTEDWRPSKKGVVVSLDLLDELINAVQSIKRGII